ncbi:plasmid pRiA4b ORF-3 family protein [Limnoglobus roseus]|uniref:Plasmid pRiA4b ORF-3 family protein n=1 Tax=Limnoglobus roseus TaxID=2598579 RepID=A0A5C1AGQ7_9BACT|nr:plasmid pRiA4b ORF-3 family protein [Limnoglobus roseus]QEL17825.1 plasmid pRiA4b ORF-3 family protein [Limnoglobus roseus]
MTPDDKPITPAQARQKLQTGLADYLAGRGSEAIVFRLKRTKKASHTYPLKLTPQQRETLLRCTHLGRTLKKKMAQAGDGTQVVPVTWNELHTLNDETGQAAVSAPSADKKRLMAVMSRVIKFFEEEDIEGFDFLLPAPAKTDRLFQFKITLLDIAPAIWRRVRVPDCTLVEFHEIIQAAFGWENYHLHQFEIGSVRYTEPAPDGDDTDSEDETDVLLSTLLPESSRTAQWVYEYDFGDGWRHEVLFEGFPPAVPKAKPPICLEGERACPPEDCGGPPGYADYLAAIADPQDEQHEELLEWRGPFDPEAFDATKATKAMRKVT